MIHFAKPLIVLLSMLGSTSAYGVHDYADDVDIIKKDIPDHLAWSKVPLTNVKKNLNNLHVQTLIEDTHHRHDKKEKIGDGVDNHDALLGMIMKHASMTRVGTRRRHLQDDECDPEVEDVFDCGTSERCLDCVLEVTESRTTFDGCSDLEDHYCEELSVCESSCGSCLDEVVELLDCFLDSNDDFSSCDITDCPTGDSDNSDADGRDDNSDSDSVCPLEVEEVIDCGPPQACLDCILEGVESRLTFSSCSDLEDHRCEEFSFCEQSCGFCMDEIIDFIDCINDNNADFSSCPPMDCPWL